jgi:hypothetical protein
MLKSLFTVFIFFAFFTDAAAFAATSLIPKNLNKTDREMTVEALGFGSAAKLLSSPYPLGGYSGVEVSVSSEYIPMADVSVLGAKTTARADLNYLNVVVGKGLYYNVDLLLQFIPMPQDASISGFGGQLRWGFYQTSFMPGNLSVVVHGSSTNFYNVLGTETSGVDLVGSMNMKDVSLFFGAGQARSVGSFIGGTGGVTESGNSESSDVYSPHTVFGISIKMSSVFLALEVDRYVQSTYAGKVGVRF